MEHLGGEPLSARLARIGALPMSETLTIGVQISDALAAVHRRGIVHRDLKTENVLVGLDPNGLLLAKLIDFGVAEVLGDAGAIDPQTVTGTPESMSPEQATASPLDRRSDIYSFGVLLYEMVTGGPPFLGGELETLLDRVVREAPVPPSQTRGARRQLIPDALERLILQCLAKHPDERPRDMDEVRERLSRIAAEYRALTAALDLAMTEGSETVSAGARVDGVVEKALVIVPEVIDAPLPVPSPVRAVGTSDERCPAGAGEIAPRFPPVARAPWSGELAIDPEPAPVVRRPAPARAQARTMAGKLGAMPAPELPVTRRRRWVRRAAAAALVAGLAAGATGLAGYMLQLPGFEILSGDIGGLEVPWER
jgi:hypothetical protein